MQGVRGVEMLLFAENQATKGAVKHLREFTLGPDEMQP